MLGRIIYGKVNIGHDMFSIDTSCLSRELLLTSTYRRHQVRCKGRMAGQFEG